MRLDGPGIVIVGLAGIYCLWFVLRTLLGGSGPAPDLTPSEDAADDERDEQQGDERAATDASTPASDDEAQQDSSGRGWLWWLTVDQVLVGTLVLAGLVLVVAAGVVLWRPSVLESIGYRPPRASRWLGRDVRYGVAGVALVVGVALYGLWRVLGIGQAGTVRTIERPVSTPPEAVGVDPRPTPGQAIDERLAAVTGPPPSHHRLRDDIEETALEALIELGGHDPDEAQRRIDAGEWTDDVRAAAYLGGEDAPRPHWRMVLWDRLRVEPYGRRWARHAVEAIEAYAAEHGGRDRR